MLGFGSAIAGLYEYALKPFIGQDNNAIYRNALDELTQSRAELQQAVNRAKRRSRQLLARSPRREGRLWLPMPRLRIGF